MPQRNYFSSESTITFLVIACAFATLWMAGAGWLDLSRMGGALPIIGAGIAASGYSISRGMVKAKREEANNCNNSSGGPAADGA
jgi:hypothetical protein